MGYLNSKQGNYYKQKGKGQRKKFYAGFPLLTQYKIQFLRPKEWQHPYGLLKSDGFGVVETSSQIP
jgi:hypothetical protein